MSKNSAPFNSVDAWWHKYPHLVTLRSFIQSSIRPRVAHSLHPFTCSILFREQSYHLQLINLTCNNNTALSWESGLYCCYYTSFILLLMMTLNILFVILLCLSLTAPTHIYSPTELYYFHVISLCDSVVVMLSTNNKLLLVENPTAAAAARRSNPNHSALPVVTWRPCHCQWIVPRLSQLG